MIAIILAAILSASGPNGCGVERQAVKTLQDPEAPERFDSFSQADVRTLIELPAPKWYAKAPRSRPEQVVYEVRGYLIGAKLEDDRDLHVVFADEQDQSKTMVIEIPHPACMSAGANPIATSMVAKTRAKFLALMRVTPSFKKFPKPLLATVKGVLFFDKISASHHPTGAADNGSELHPCLELRLEK